MEPPVSTHIEVIYEDRWLAAFNKPSPLPVHPAGVWYENTMTRLLKKKYPKKVFFSMHRLDLETSGIILFSKEKSLTALLQKNLSLSKKYYISGVYGKTPASFETEFPLGPKQGAAVMKRKGVNPQTGKWSRTRFRKICASGGRTFLVARPFTGRTHQIRAHLRESGYPVIGDKIYGRDENNFLDFLKDGLTPELLKKLELSRQFLHCRKILYCHPFLKKTLCLVARLPDELRDYIFLRKFQND